MLSTYLLSQVSASSKALDIKIRDPKNKVSPTWPPKYDLNKDDISRLTSVHRERGDDEDSCFVPVKDSKP